MEKIARLKLAPIFEGAAITEAASDVIKIVSVGAKIKISDSGNAMAIAAASGDSAKYKKVEDKDVELPVLQNELAGLVGGFDASVHKLMAKYGYEWIDGKSSQNTVVESIYEATGGDPTGSWIGDYLVVKVISISKLVDIAADQYDFGDDRDTENRFRAKVKELMKDDPENLVGSEFDDRNLINAVTTFLSDYEDELEEFADYI